MGIKRKAPGTRHGPAEGNQKPGAKHEKQEGKFVRVPQKEQELVFAPRPDWHAIELPELPELPAGDRMLRAVPQYLLENLENHAHGLLEAENGRYASSTKASSSSQKFLSTIMSSGTLEDKVSAFTLMVQESPLHSMKAFENLIGLARKKSRNQALMAIAALKDLLSQGMVLPGDRKLRAFSKQPALLASIPVKASKWNAGDPLPGAIKDVHLIYWAYEDWLKKMYFELLKILEGWSADEVEYARSRAVTFIWELLKEKPEQEENLLRLLVNKLGDTDKKIASRTSYLILQLEIAHPVMKSIIINSIENESLFRPGQSMHAKYYAIITLNQTILGKNDADVANQLLKIYFALFVQLLKPPEKLEVDSKPKHTDQGGGGKPGRKAAQKVKAQVQDNAMQEELREKMVAQILTGVNRAFPFAETDNPAFEQQMDTMFRVTHSANFNTAIQALSLIQRISATKHYSADRFYRTLYESLLDPRLLTSSKQIMYLNLLYRSLKADINIKRVQAFVKRLLQMITMHEPPFVCGILYLVSELETSFPTIRNMINEAEMGIMDEEEHYVDAPDDDDAPSGIHADRTKNFLPPVEAYDPRKRDPEHSHADRSALWETIPFLAHFHPSVAVFAEALALARPMPPKPDPASHSLMHFLDRFIYRNAKTKPSSTRGSSIMQPLSGSNAADLLVKTRGDRRDLMPLNSDAFWRKDVSQIPADEVFFHSYFNQTNKQKPSSKKQAKQQAADESEQEDLEEDEIWKALVDSKPDIEGEDDEDDLSVGDLEDAYSDSDGGADDDDLELADNGGVEIADFPEDDDEGQDLDGDNDAADEDEMPDLESGDDALLDDEDELPPGFRGFDEEEEKPAEGGDAGADDGKRKKKRKLKHLPTFASAEDYAKMLADEPDEY